MPNGANVLSNAPFLLAGGIGLAPRAVAGARGVRGRSGALAVGGVLRGPHPDRAGLRLVSPRARQYPAGLGPAAHDGGLHGPLRRHDRRAHRTARRRDPARPAPGGRRGGACCVALGRGHAARGDLRLYGLVQFFPDARRCRCSHGWFPPRYTHGGYLGARGAELRGRQGIRAGRRPGAGAGQPGERPHAQARDGRAGRRADAGAGCWRRRQVCAGGRR